MTQIIMTHASSGSIISISQRWTPTLIFRIFFVNNIQVSAIFSGDGFIDRNLSTVNDGGDFWSVIQTSLNTISFVPQAGCVSSLNRYDIPIGDCSSPFIEVYIIAPPGGNPQLDEVQITAFSTYPCDDDFCIFSD